MRYFVVAVEYDTEEIDHKAFESEERADQWYASFAGLARASDKLAGTPYAAIASCRLYHVEAPDVRSAVDMVKAGKALQLKDSADPAD